jgi:hypothetical protein
MGYLLDFFKRKNSYFEMKNESREIHLSVSRLLPFKTCVLIIPGIGKRLKRFQLVEVISISQN